MVRAAGVSRAARQDRVDEAKPSRPAHRADAAGARSEGPFTQGEILHLQRLVGNQTVLHLLNRRAQPQAGAPALNDGGLGRLDRTEGRHRGLGDPEAVRPQSGPLDQTARRDRLRVGAASDRFERQAEQVANRVMSHASDACESPDLGAQAVQRKTGTPVIQRHASYEHRLLGDVPPDALFALGAQSELAGQDGDDYVVHGPTGDETVARDNVVHILDQELRRLKAWQLTEPKLTSMADIGEKTGRFKAVVEQAAKENHDTDSEWDVRIIAIPSTAKGGTPLLVTYGELNTLADFYGSVDELKAADPAKRRNVVQSVRSQSYTELLKIYKKVATSDEAKQGATALEGTTFAGSFTISGAVGELNQMGTDRKGGSGTTMYMATLARNACHFAPESWHAWEDHHHKALALAGQAHAEQDGKKKAAKLNEALLVNGFGDHYLQDSYAAGHLINKTKIMQMYVRHLDKNPPVTAGYTTDPTWRAFQSMAYNQDGLTDDRQYDKSRIGRRDIGGQQVSTAQNPQTVENTQSLGRNFNWQDRFKMLGLTVPTGAKPGTPAWKLLVWMQKQRGGWLTTRYEVNFDANELKGKSQEIGISKLDVNDAIRSLLDGNIIYKIGESRTKAGERLDIGEHSVAGMFTLRKEWVVSVTGGNEKKFNSAVATTDTGDSPEYDKMAQATVYKDYVLFMRDSYLQKATNAAHDYFCEEGLKVSSGQGKQLFQIYGDYNMLEKDSSVGLRDSAETSNMSRDSVSAMASTGAEPNGKDTATILGRLPSWVEPPEGGAAISLADWQTRDGKLEAWLGPNVFDKMNVVINLAMGVSGNLGKITEDENVHGSEAF